MSIISTHPKKRNNKMINAIFFKDGYKADHKSQYPDGTQFVYANFTPRGSRVEGSDYVIVFGIQYLIKKFFMEDFQKTFFDRDEETVVKEYQDLMDSYLGEGSINTEHIRSLHQLGYLPILIKALPEGFKCPMQVPFMTIVNTDPKFFWVTNMLETLISTTLWHPITSATTAQRYRKLMDDFAIKTGSPLDFVPFQGHDFSMRGLTGVEAACASGAAHLTSFCGSDTIPAISWIKKYYNGEGLIAASVPASEHSVMCLGEKDTEINTFRRLINEVYPKGIVSIVSDTWDFWKVVTEFLPTLKDEIMNREGKVVIRPDSGNPVDIICGDITAPEGSPEEKGLIQCLYEIFGGSQNEKGFIELDEHIGAIYGDSITYGVAESILERLASKGFASSNIVFGIGSYTYQYVTRDTYGFAVKATMGIVNGEMRKIFKDPKTDDGLKKSAKGLLSVKRSEDGGLSLINDCSVEEERLGELLTVFADGVLIDETNFDKIRKTIGNGVS
jgi:nicotinamide phosphoribosyltransferase